MKKHLNINRVLMVGVAFFCLFFTMNNVEAKNVTCTYSIGPSPMDSWYNKNKVSLKITYSNKKAQIAYYDSSNKSYTSSELEKHGLWMTDESVQNIQSWDYEKKSCPNLYWTVSLTSTGGQEVTYYTDSSQIYGYNSTNMDSCASTATCGACSKTGVTDDSNPGNTNSSGNGNSQNQNNDNSTCKYAPVSSSGSSFDNTIIISLNGMYITEKTGVFEDYSLDINFTKEDVNSSCPKTIYLKYISGNPKSLILKDDKKNSKGTYFEELGLVSVLKKGPSDGNEKDGCKSLGTTKSILTNIYSFIRFLIPTVIIVLSVIEFLGVVLSGENEKMEKAKKRFVTRLIVGFVILIIPSILELIFKLAGILGSNENLTDVVCNIID